MEIPLDFQANHRLFVVARFHFMTCLIFFFSALCAVTGYMVTSILKIEIAAAGLSILILLMGVYYSLFVTVNSKIKVEFDSDAGILTVIKKRHRAFAICGYLKREVTEKINLGEVAGMMVHMELHYAGFYIVRASGVMICIRAGFDRHDAENFVSIVNRYISFRMEKELKRKNYVAAILTSDDGTGSGSGDKGPDGDHNDINSSPLSSVSSECNFPENVLSQNPPIQQIAQTSMINVNRTPEITFMHEPPIRRNNSYRPPLSLSVPILVPLPQQIQTQYNQNTNQQYLLHSRNIPIPPPSYIYNASLIIDDDNDSTNQQQQVQLLQPVPSAAYTPGLLGEMSTLNTMENIMRVFVGEQF
ncbi:MAG: hypothetical protein EZS28_005006 [Streblomastix strix]|uniref:Uncharacterized protein n=1 Tax=Streblomastix strix TaxID=222440 RepID=A0A5J4WYB5_9EUKA|nr:MAG: hypothetical protein EZS28_005006 [Streblomastix strix]